MSFESCINLWNYHHDQDTEYFHHPKNSVKLLCSPMTFGSFNLFICFLSHNQFTIFFCDGLHSMNMMLTFIYVVWCNNGHPCLSRRVIWRFYPGSPTCERPIWLIAGYQSHDMVHLTGQHTLLSVYHFLHAYINVCIVLWSSASICVTISKSRYRIILSS